MDTVIKQRLIGAAVLVALAVIFLPMLFDGSDEGSLQRVPVEIPNYEGENLQRRVIELDRADELPAEEEDFVDLPAPSSVGGEPSLVVPADTPPDPAPKVPASVENGDPSTQESIATEADSAEPVTQSGPEGGSERYLFRLGAFGNAANAAALVKQVEGLGFPAFTEDIYIAGRKLYRVQVGPFLDQQAVQRAKTQLQTLADSPIRVERTSNAGLDGGFAVQVASFSRAENAEALQLRLEDGGFASFSEEVLVGNTTQFRVIAGPVSDRGSAERIQQQIQDRFELKGLVIEQ